MNAILYTLIIINALSTTLKSNPMLDSLKQYLQDKNSEKAIEFITAYPDILNDIDSSKSSGFMLIAYSGLDAVFKKSKKLKQNFNFHEAIVAGRIKEVQTALSIEANIANRYSDDGFTPLSLAAFFNQIEIAKLLIKHGADPKLHATHVTKVNALHSAVAKENIKLCQLFIKHGMDVNAVQIQDVTPLHSAVHRGNLNLVKLLVEYGAKPEQRMANGESAIDIAKREKQEAILTFFKSL